MMFFFVFMYFSICFFFVCFISGGQSATIATALTTLFIWFLAILCGLPGLIGSEVKVRAKRKATVLYQDSD